MGAPGHISCRRRNISKVADGVETRTPLGNNSVGLKPKF